MEFIDLRSDTLTRPSPEMREAMASAEVGDDVFGEDPTVNKLQDKIKELTGKDAALFVTSGTQANQVSINAHTQPGNEVICEYRSHIFNYEAGSPAMLSGVQLHPIYGEYGIIKEEDIIAAIRNTDHHFPQTKLIALENTHNRWGGTIYPIENIEKTAIIASEHDISMHLDGARPVPLHSEQRTGDVPGSARLPLHSGHVSWRVTSISFSHPKTASSKVKLRS